MSLFMYICIFFFLYNNNRTKEPMCTRVNNIRKYVMRIIPRGFDLDGSHHPKRVQQPD